MRTENPTRARRASNDFFDNIEFGTNYALVSDNLIKTFINKQIIQLNMNMNIGEPWKAPDKCDRTRIVGYSKTLELPTSLKAELDEYEGRIKSVQYGVVVRFLKSPDTPGLNQYADRFFIARRLMIGNDFYGAISHPDWGKGRVLDPKINEILSCFLLPEPGGVLRSEGQYIGYMFASYDEGMGTWNRFLEFDDNGNAVFEKEGNVGKIILNNGKARALTAEEEKQFEKYKVSGITRRTGRPELITVSPRFKEVEFEFREPGKEILLEEMLRLHIAHYQ